MIKKIPLNKLYINNEAKKFINIVISSKKFADGLFQKKCEKFIKKKVKSNFIALTQSCTSALEIASILIDLKPGDEVIMPSYTFTSTANSVVLRGAKPVFVDVDLYNLNLDIESIERKITKKTKAIYLVHYGGISCDMNKLMQLKKKRKLFIIEDTAHGFLGMYGSKFLGTIGDFGTYSFHETKNFVGGQCGALSINNKSYIKRAQIILDKGTDRIEFNKPKKNKKKSYYSWKNVGSEFRATELSSALLFSQLKNYHFIQKNRKKIWNSYLKIFNLINNKYFHLQKISKKMINAHHVFAVIFNNIKLRNKFMSHMKNHNIVCTFHYVPLHMSTYGKKFCKYKLVNTEKIFNGLVRLPIYPTMTRLEFKQISTAIKIFFKNK